MHILIQNENGFETKLLYSTKKSAEAHRARYKYEGEICEAEYGTKTVFHTKNLGTILSSARNFHVFADDNFVCSLENRQDAQLLARSLRPYYREIYVKTDKIMAII